MSHGRERMTLGLMTGGGAGAGEAQERRGPAGGERSGPPRPAAPSPCDVLRLLASLVAGAHAPVIAGGIATITSWVPFGVLDGLSDCVARLVPETAAAGPPDASGAWSGVLLPMLREAERLLPDIFDGTADAVAAPAGGYLLTFRVDLAMHDRLALWGASLDLVEHLVGPLPLPPALPLTALEPGIPQEMAAVVLGLYAAEGRPPSGPPEAAPAA